jgi:DNA modification methylase
MSVRVEHIGDCTLMLGDCAQILPTLGKVDAVLTDPPYGIGMDGGKVGRSQYNKFDWDNAPADIEFALELGVPAIIWGGNYFSLPPSQKWLVWDKKNDPTTYADCELAWTNIAGSVRVFRWLWSGPYQERREERFHPTQKPLALMEWCLDHLPTDVRSVCDPFMGSGTTGVACAKRGLHFIGIEREPSYFDIACRRVEEAYRSPDLFIEHAKKEKAKPADFFGSDAA